MNEEDTTKQADADEPILDREELTDEEGSNASNASNTDASEPADYANLSVHSEKDVGLPEHRDLGPDEIELYKGLVEAILFLSNEPVSISTLARKCGLDRTNTRIMLDTLVDDYAERDGGFSLREIAGGYQFITSDRYSESLKQIMQEQKKDKLSRSTIETLAIICYRQPITLPEIEEIRGVNSRAMVVQLAARKLIKPQGYRPVPGRPTLYVTTRQFLNRFALNSLTDLPALEDIKELNFDDLD